MSVRSQFAASRGRPFAEAADDYVARVRDHANEHHAGRATAIKRSVMRQLSTDDRRHLVYRFAQFFGLSRAAGVDPMDLCFDPPLFTSQVRGAFSQASPGWVASDALADPAQPGHRVFLATVPELCCFGFIATEVVTPVMLKGLKAGVEGDPAGFARTFNADLAKAISALSASTALSDHESRALFTLVKALERVVGEDFSFDTLDDDHLLEAWPDVAATKDLTRFTALMRQLAVLSAELTAAAAADVAADAAPLDAMAVEPGIERLEDRADATANALSDPLIVELLSRDEHKMIQQQLRDFAALQGLHLSRARALTFGPVEDKLVQAKRDARDLARVVGAPATNHADTVAALGAAHKKLQVLTHAGLHLLWQQGQRREALRLAVEAGHLSHADVRAVVPEAASVASCDLAALDDALAQTQTDGRLQQVLETGRTAWYLLRRRKAFGALESDAAGADALGEAAGHAALLGLTLSDLQARIEAAVRTCREGDAFAAEHQRFCAALARVHGFAFSAESPQ